MSENTKIEWATSTGNPWIGCTKVSPGCKNCYAAELDANRFSRAMGGGTTEKPVSHWGKGAPRFKTKGFWKDAVKWNRDCRVRCLECSKWHPHVQWVDVDVTPHIGLCRSCGRSPMAVERPRIFPSLCDWLDDEVPVEWLADFLKLIHDTLSLDWLLLTKRPENWKKRLQDAVASGFQHDINGWLADWLYENKPPTNVWLGVSVEDQKRADERIPLLLQTPAKVRFLSVEPLLEKVGLPIFGHEDCEACKGTMFYGDNCAGRRGNNEYVACDSKQVSGIHWIIIGGESGKGRRDCGVEAICDVARQCVVAGVPCFVKQDSAFKPGQKGRIDDATWALKQFPK